MAVDPLLELRSALAHFRDPPTLDRGWSDPSAVGRVFRKIEETFGLLSSEAINRDSIADAVLRYQSTGKIASLQDLKYTCFGATTAIRPSNYLVIEDSTRFGGLLARVSDLGREPRTFRRCYQGLLLGYLEYPGLWTEHDQGRKNWRALRRFLEAGLDRLLAAGPITPWMHTLSEHRNLLSESPCTRYGPDLLAGDSHSYHAVRNGLSLTDRSWVPGEIILSRIEAATKCRDSEFLPDVDQAVTLLEEQDRYPAVVNRGLGLILTRYAKTLSATEHRRLRDFAVARWGNPWLQNNEAQWLSHVSDSGRHMVAQWLKLRCIEDFFSLLQSDGSADKRRLKFWLRYVDAIDDMYFALGTRAYSSPSIDYRRIRQGMQGRLMRLDSINPTNNAFLMVIGDHVFIEFGQKGNACHIFRQSRNMPFKLGQERVADTGKELKNIRHPSHHDRLLHKDGNEDWETRFELTIRELTGRKANVIARHREKRVEANQMQFMTDTSKDTSTRKGEPFSDRDLSRFVTTHKLRIEDLRSKGGNLWVITGEGRSEIVNRLREWGFKYKPDRGWWRT